jgi:hypothetical protein
MKKYGILLILVLLVACGRAAEEPEQVFQLTTLDLNEQISSESDIDFNYHLDGAGNFDAQSLTFEDTSFESTLNEGDTTSFSLDLGEINLNADLGETIEITILQDGSELKLQFKDGRIISQSYSESTVQREQ